MITRNVDMIFGLEISAMCGSRWGGGMAGGQNPPEKSPIYRVPGSAGSDPLKTQKLPGQH